MPDVQELNRDLANRLIEEVKKDRQSAYNGKFVGLANGQIIVVTENLAELAQRLRQAEPDPARTFIVEPGRDLDEVFEVWETC